MMGVSPYMTRDQLLHIKSTGDTPEISARQQEIFDRGHSAEESARPIVENMLAEELYNAVATHTIDGLPLLASLDGITCGDDVIFEHKLWNKTLAEQIGRSDLSPHYYWQLEHQILVTGADHVVFVCSDGTEQQFAYMVYTPVDGRAEQLIAGWQQFAADLGSYEPTELVADAVAGPLPSLPAITYEMTGLSLSSNLSRYRAAAEILLERSRQPLITDQDFADREALCKQLKTAESRLKDLQAEVLGEVADIRRFTDELRDMADDFRMARLIGERSVKAEKDRRKLAMIDAARAALTEHCRNCDKSLGIHLPPVAADFSAAIKGRRSLASIQSAVNDELAAAKIRANSMENVGRANLRAYKEMAADSSHLFPDLSILVFSAPELFISVVRGRIDEYRRSEAARAERETIIDEHDIAAERDEAEICALIEQSAVIEISVAEYDRLIHRDRLLSRLEAAGVDNWIGYDDAIKIVESAAA